MYAVTINKTETYITTTETIITTTETSTCPRQTKMALMIIIKGVIAVEHLKTVVICDSHPVARYGLSQILERESDIKVVAETSNSFDLINALSTYKPSIVILDIDSACCDVDLILGYINSDGVDFSSKIIIYTSTTNDSTVEKAAKLGCNGYLLKRAEFSEIVKAINVVHNNGTVLDPDFATHLLKHLRATDNSKVEYDALSKREREVLSLIAAGASNRFIAKKLYIGECTVKFHVSSILAKLNVKNRTEAASIAIQGGILQP